MDLTSQVSRESTPKAGWAPSCGCHRWGPGGRAACCGAGSQSGGKGQGRELPGSRPSTQWPGDLALGPGALIRKGTDGWEHASRPPRGLAEVLRSPCQWLRL